MSTSPPREVDVTMEKKDPGREVTIFLDSNSLLPIRPDGITDEQFKQRFERHAEGYPQLAAVINSDEQSMIYRRFGFLQTRLLLNKQEEMRVLEDRLYHIDRYYGRNEPARLRSHDTCNAIDDDHKNIVVEIEKKYNEYAQLLTHARTLARFDKPRAADYLQLKAYFKRKAPLCGDKQQ
ncbi:uncharacterized protein EAF01_011612 [Botrytis porri]|uniref:uncharacterized protein n=1 Tax=Botrytis porri TaxID=87229 RepID=UPI0019013D87|nr:uncharacterized protein EAF01_011612 [Botrytis porri]KAF7883103.1 hypothetical protein EAF01_011612 [Botrytis porri]